MSNLSKFNIRNLFSDRKSTTPQNFTGQLDIKTLFPRNSDTNYNFDSKKLLKSIYEKKKKLKSCYNVIFKKCCENIESANKSGFTYITYEIPEFSEYVGYSCDDCILFLRKKLEEQNLDVCRVDSRTIYISWTKLEEKISNIFKSQN
jgi:hypothetical protein